MRQLFASFMLSLLLSAPLSLAHADIAVPEQGSSTAEQQTQASQEIDYSAYTATPVHGVAMHGSPKYKADFTHFEYVTPYAAKGGTMRLHSIGTFDSLNPFITKGIQAANIGLMYDTLTQHASDEPFTEYGLIAETIEMPEDRSWVAFNLRKEAKWHDGKPLTAEDVIWTFNILREKGRPFYRAYYAGVKEVVATDPHRVLFIFHETENQELPLILGQLPVLPKHYWEGREFGDTTLEPPLGSGPYKVGKVEAGRYIEYIRVPDYWGRAIPVNLGRYNFDRITVDYYRDTTVAVEAFFANEYDYRMENTAKVWASAYVNNQVASGRVIKREIPHQQPAGMQGFAMNTRRAPLNDIEVRKAITLAFDFEWSNKKFAYDSYTRTDSYFENSELQSSGVPVGREKEILLQFRDQLPLQVFTMPFTVPRTDGSGRNRHHLKRANDILEEAGYQIGGDGIRVDPKTKQKLSIEIIDNQPAFERWTLPFIQNLRKIGIEATFRVVDTSQYVNRMQSFDFDMTILSVGQSLSPGNEQLEFWHSSKVDEQGSRNYMGVNDPVVDELIKMIIEAPDREELVHRTRALDRVLLWGHYVVPHWHINKWRVAYWDKFSMPDFTADQSLNAVDTWWIGSSSKK